MRFAPLLVFVFACGPSVSLPDDETGTEETESGSGDGESESGGSADVDCSIDDWGELAACVGDFPLQACMDENGCGEVPDCETLICIAPCESQSYAKSAACWDELCPSMAQERTAYFGCLDACLSEYESCLVMAQEVMCPVEDRDNCMFIERDCNDACSEP